MNPPGSSADRDGARGATPEGLDDALRRAAGTVTGRDPASLPAADPRCAPSSSGGEYTSPLPLRLPGPQRDPAALAAEVAAELRTDPNIGGAWAAPPGFVVFTLTGEARASLAAAAGAGWEYLAGRTTQGKSSPRWAYSPLERAATIAEAHSRARADARGRLAVFPGSAPVDLAGPGITWRDPYQDRPAGAGETARLLAAVGEASTRTALCRSSSERPRPGESTGPGLPALPTADAPGEWVRLTEANPAFAVRYARAHAHATVYTWAPRSGLRGVREPSPAEGTPAALDTAPARLLLGALFEGPALVAAAARRAQPHILVRYLERLADTYYEWAGSCHVPAAGAAEGRGGTGLGPATAARLDLCAAVDGVLATGLFLLGVSAPTRL